MEGVPVDGEFAQQVGVGQLLEVINANNATVQTISGQVLAKFVDVSDARFTPSGEIFTVSHSGLIQWKVL